ncbi:helix-turn-helix transcriptional regulator [Tunturiibacter gelidoferens]|uniref:Response regulator transcription factor n=2 Tax=Tunturiibacter gelidiferens TaxID=3069689 RepID=A0AAU7Z5U6_9BACT|nr:response regulator transcription factor [Edaphobacter lichenicola]MBB5339644.1 DNA-binding NarL/FixJ family response regulator [Edaphobacter lichenicola]
MLSKGAAQAMKDTKDKKVKKAKGSLRVGLVAADPLRILGLQTIFPDGGPVEVVPLSVPGALDASGVSLILIDSACTEHIFELLATFRRTRPRFRLMVLGLEEDHEHIQRIIGAGAKGYLAHSAKESEIRMAIDVVQDGSVWAPRKVLARLLESTSAGAETTTKPAKEPKFTKRELQVLRLLAAGHPNPAIGRELGIDVGTVKKHVGNLMRKVGVDNRIALSVQAVNQKLLLKR